MQNYRKIYAIKNQNEKKIKELCPNIEHKSGIYVFYRTDELGINHSYVGQASKSVWARCAEHLSGFQYADISIKKHKLYSENNPYGYKLRVECYAPPEQLDELERRYIVRYGNASQLKNILSGGQGAGKIDITDRRATKGYRKGVEAGYKKASKEIANLFEKHLNYNQKSDKPNKNQEKAMQKFQNFLEYYKGTEED